MNDIFSGCHFRLILGLEYTLADFDFDLPKELIAQYPLAERSGSKLLSLNRRDGSIKHLTFKDFPKLLLPEDLLIFNDTKVIPARILAQKITGANIELLLEKIISPKIFLAHLGANKPLKIGTELILSPEVVAKIIGREGDLFILELQNDLDILTLFENFGHVPLPPYISRRDELLDRDRYQTVFAKKIGAVAAPTAGLHFDQKILTEISARKVAIDFVTLHVGAGTFQSIRTNDIFTHRMHKERITVSEELCTKITQTKKRGGRIIAVGTTVVRALETSARYGEIKPMQGETDIFIYPGFKFQVVDALLTNFHLPKSSLILLVAAFTSREQILSAYKEAINKCYRFFSYGDAMFISYQ